MALKQSKASTGDAIASLLALQAPTALLVEEEDAVLVEREVDAKLLVECMASYLVLSTMNYDQVWNLVGLINNSSRREVIEQCILFGVEHDEQTWIWTIITRKVSCRC